MLKMELPDPDHGMEAYVGLRIRTQDYLQACSSTLQLHFRPQGCYTFGCSDCQHQARLSAGWAMA